MIYHFKDIQNGQIKKGYTSLQIENHQVEVDPADTEAILLAEKYGGELWTQQGRPPKDPDKYRAEQVGDADELRFAAEAAIQKKNQSDLTKAVESGKLATEDAPRLTDPVAKQQQEDS